MSPSNVENKIIEFLRENSSFNSQKIGENDNLFENEVWDSLLIVRFFAHLEETFSLSVDLAAVQESDIESLSALVHFVNGLMKS